MNTLAITTPLGTHASHNTTPSNDIPQNTHWYKLTSYGNYVHKQGLQCISAQAAATMVSRFNSIRGRLARRFGGLPVYIGHPDDPLFSTRPGHDDTRAYGWIHNLEARQDALYAQIKWSNDGLHLLEEAFYKFLSPRWRMKDLGNGQYEPVELISVGLTNAPNIPQDAIANEEALNCEACSLDEHNKNDQSFYTGSVVFDKPFLNALGLAADATAEDVRTAINDLKQQMESMRLADSSFANEREARIDLLLDIATREARIPDTEHERWKKRFQQDFDDTLAALANAHPALPTQSVTTSLGKRGRAARTQELVATVKQRMAATGEDFTTAWHSLKRECDAFNHKA